MQPTDLNGPGVAQATKKAVPVHRNVATFSHETQTSTTMTNMAKEGKDLERLKEEVEYLRDENSQAHQKLQGMTTSSGKRSADESRATDEAIKECKLEAERSIKSARNEAQSAKAELTKVRPPITGRQCGLG
jgi:uncharacterized coiled-coil DUF342 family protein